jgi:hypothetical protein
MNFQSPTQELACAIQSVREEVDELAILAGQMGSQFKSATPVISTIHGTTIMVVCSYVATTGRFSVSLGCYVTEENAGYAVSGHFRIFVPDVNTDIFRCILRSPLEPHNWEIVVQPDDENIPDGFESPLAILHASGRKNTLTKEKMYAAVPLMLVACQIATRRLSQARAQA